MQVSGEIDQSAGMLDDEVKDKGYALLCVAEPRTDCVIKTIEEASTNISPLMPVVAIEVATGPFKVALCATDRDFTSRGLHLCL